MARILFFGRLRDIAGPERDMALPANARTVAALRALLAAENAELGSALASAGVRVAVDQRFARDATPLNDASEIAFMPAMSGG